MSYGQGNSVNAGFMHHRFCLVDRCVVRGFAVYDWGLVMDFSKKLDDESVVYAVLHQHTIGKQKPYFSATFGGCADHEGLVAHFPELEFMVKWHLCTDGIPTHYVANSIYWYQTYKGVSQWESRFYDPDPLQAFYNACVWGVSKLDKPENIDLNLHVAKYETDDVKRLFRAEMKEMLTPWLNARIPELQETWVRDWNRLVEIYNGS